MFLVATAVELPGVVTLVRALQHAFRVRRQISHADGVIRVVYRPNGLLVHLTLSAWEGRDHACAFRDAFTGELQMFWDIGEVWVTSWEADKLPSWGEVRERLRVEREHARYAPPRTL
jgi:hypothetical protein